MKKDVSYISGSFLFYGKLGKEISKMIITINHLEISFFQTTH